MKPNSKAKMFRLKEATCKQIKELSEEKKISETAILEMAVLNLYTQDSLDENILLGRLGFVEKKLQYIDSKVDTFFRFIHFILPNVFSRLPSLPKDKDERNLVLENGGKTMYNLLMLFRRDEKKNHLSYMQSVYGDSQESLEESYDRGVSQ